MTGDRPEIRQRRTDCDLLFGLMFALGEEHKARTGHDYTKPVATRMFCDTCMHLRNVCDELEARQYD